MAEIEEYDKWEKSLATINFPIWDELPKLELYMDQVVAYVNSIIGSLGLDLITSSMINNYVKKNVVLAPVKKKYQVMHIADILIITLLKSTYPLDVIRSGMNQVTSHKYPKQAYDHFVELLNQRLSTHELDADGGKTIEEKLMIIAVDSIIITLKARELLKLMERNNQPQEIKKTK